MLFPTSFLILTFFTSSPENMSSNNVRHLNFYPHLLIACTCPQPPHFFPTTRTIRQGLCNFHSLSGEILSSLSKGLFPLRIFLNNIGKGNYYICTIFFMGSFFERFHTYTEPYHTFAYPHIFFHKEHSFMGYLCQSRSPSRSSSWLHRIYVYHLKIFHNFGGTR